MSENNITVLVGEALHKANANLINSRMTAHSEQELQNMIKSIDEKVHQLRLSRAELSGFIHDHTSTVRL